MDFEFTNLGKKQLVLISGAIADNQNQIKKLAGPPLLLNKQYIRPLTERERARAVLQMVRIFWKKGKTEYLYAVLAQWHDSVNSDINTLKASTIHDYIYKTNKRERKLIILWNGHTDNEILEQLKINSHEVGNMTCCDYKNDNEFYLKLINFKTKQEICSYYVGKINKTGHQLNLVETHAAICNKEHNIIHAHDPCCDVILTRCLFSYISKLEKNSDLINYNFFYDLPIQSRL